MEAKAVEAKAVEARALEARAAGEKPAGGKPAERQAVSARVHAGRTRGARQARLAACLLVAGVVTGGAGCAGAQTDVTAKESRYPISFSPVLVDEEGRPVYLGEELEEVGALKEEGTRVGFLYAMTGIDHDISEVVNREVEAAGGEGVVQLSIASQQCALNYMFPLTILPIWPGCMTQSVSGVIVRRKGSDRSAGESARLNPARSSAPEGAAPAPAGTPEGEP